jgi:hypothetical protein
VQMHTQLIAAFCFPPSLICGALGWAATLLRCLSPPVTRVAHLPPGHLQWQWATPQSPLHFVHTDSSGWNQVRHTRAHAQTDRHSGSVLPILHCCSSLLREHAAVLQAVEGVAAVVWLRVPAAAWQLLLLLHCCHRGARRRGQHAALLRRCWGALDQPVPPCHPRLCVEPSKWLGCW